MKLMTKEILARIPELYSQEEKGEDAIVHVKFFDPCGLFTWFATEFSPETKEFFGWVCGFEQEFGYFSLTELESIKGPLGLGIERDLHFTPKTIAECRGKHS